MMARVRWIGVGAALLLMLAASSGWGCYALGARSSSGYARSAGSPSTQPQPNRGDNNQPDSPATPENNGTPDRTPDTGPDTDTPPSNPADDLNSMALADDVALSVPPIVADRSASLGGSRYALLILADEYADSPRWNLTREANLIDRRLRPALVGHLGIAPERIVTLRGGQVTPQAIESALLERIGDRVAGSGNLVTIYYFGHGATRPAAGGVPADVLLFTHYSKREGNDFDRVLTQTELAGMIGRLRDRMRANGADARVLTVVDACRIPTLAPAGPAELRPISDADLYSASDGQFAEAGVFTDAFVNALEEESDAGDALYLGPIFDKTKADVERATNGAQSPALTRPLGRFPLRATGGNTVRVRAVHASTGDPIRNAEVLLNDRTLASPAVFESLPNGDYFVQVRANGFFWRAEELAVQPADDGMTIDIPLVPEFVLVTGIVENSSGTRTRVRLEAGDAMGLAVIGHHVGSAEVRGTDTFALRIPAAAVNGSVQVLGDDSEVVGQRSLSQAFRRFVDVDVRDDTRAVGSQRLRHYDVGRIAIGDAVRADSIADVIDDPTLGPLQFPEIALSSEGARALWEQAIRQAEAGKLDAAEQMLAGLMEREALNEAGTEAVDRLREELRFRQAHANYETDPAIGIEQLSAGLAAGQYRRTNDRVRRQLLRWLGTAAADAMDSGDPPTAVERLEAAADLLRPASDRALRSAIDAQRSAAWRAYAESAVEAAMQDDSWDTASRVLDRATAAMPGDAAIGRWADTLQRERMPRDARESIARADAAFAEGRLDIAEQAYRSALPDANAHYRQRIESQLGQLGDLQFARYVRIGSEHQIEGNNQEALRAYLAAFRYDPLGVQFIIEPFGRNDPRFRAIWAEHADLVAEWDDYRALPSNANGTRYVSARQAFIADHPYSPFADRARAEIGDVENSAWDAVARSGTLEARIESLDGFLERFPKGAHASEAKRQRGELEREQAAWARVESARVNGSLTSVRLESLRAELAALTAYRSAFADGVHATYARDRIAELQRVLASRTAEENDRPTPDVDNPRTGTPLQPELRRLSGSLSNGRLRGEHTIDVPANTDMFVTVSAPGSATSMTVVLPNDADESSLSGVGTYSTFVPVPQSGTVTLIVRAAFPGMRVNYTLTVEFRAARILEPGRVRGLLEGGDAFFGQMLLDVYYIDLQAGDRLTIHAVSRTIPMFVSLVPPNDSANAVDASDTLDMRGATLTHTARVAGRYAIGIRALGAARFGAYLLTVDVD